MNILTKNLEAQRSLPTLPIIPSISLIRPSIRNPLPRLRLLAKPPSLLLGWRPQTKSLVQQLLRLEEFTHSPSLGSDELVCNAMKGMHFQRGVGVSMAISRVPGLGR